MEILNTLPKRRYEEDFFNRDKLRKDIKKSSISGALNRFVLNGSSFILSLISTIILARLLSPHEFGIVAMVHIFTEFTRSFGEVGLGSSTVQAEKTNHSEVSALFWINFSVGILLFLIFICFSPVIAFFFKNNEIILICLVMSPIFLLRGLTVQHRALLERQMRFGSLGVNMIFATALSVSIAIILSFLKYGVWALVFREITFTFFYAAGVWILIKWIPGLPKKNININKNLRFGLDLTYYDIIQYASKNLDGLLIGRFCGSDILGLYSKAQQIAMMPIEQVRSIFWGIGFTSLSTLQNQPDKFNKYYSKMLFTMSFFYFPIVFFMAIESNIIIKLILGEAWLRAVPLFTLFILIGLTKPLMGMLQLVMISTSKSRRVVSWGIINALCTITGYLIGIRWGSIGVASAYMIVSIILLIWSNWYCSNKTHVNAFLTLKSISFPLIISSITTSIYLAFHKLISIQLTLVELFLLGIIYFLMYMAFWFIFPKGRKYVYELISYFKEIKSNKSS